MKTPEKCGLSWRCWHNLNSSGTSRCHLITVSPAYNTAMVIKACQSCKTSVVKTHFMTETLTQF